MRPAPDGSPYAAELAAARERSGCDEAIITGEGGIHGRRVALIAGEFRFLAGSIGAVAAERIVVAFERALREELPVFAAPASGGTRMQEGTPAFVGVFEHGPIDAILPVEALAETADRALNVLMGIREGPPDVPDVPDVPTESLAASPAWDSIVRSRRAHRPACAPCS